MRGSLRCDNVTAHCPGRWGHARMVGRTWAQPRPSHGSPQVSKPGSETSPPSSCMQTSLKSGVLPGHLGGSGVPKAHLAPPPCRHAPSCQSKRLLQPYTGCPAQWGHLWCLPTGPRLAAAAPKLHEPCLLLSLLLSQPWTPWDTAGGRI